MKVKLLTILLFLATVRFLTITGPIFGDNSSKQILQKKMERVLAKCKTDENIVDQVCVYKDFGKIINKKNLENSIDSIVEIYSEKSTRMQYGSPRCHIHAHMVGQIANKKGIPFSEILKVCSNKCGSGCIHGAFQSSSSIAEIIDYCETTNFSNEIDRDMCWHAIGHNLGEYFGEQIEEAGKLCTSLKDEDKMWQCFTGLEMEKVNPPLGGKTAVSFTQSGYVKFCNSFPEYYRNDCYSNIGNHIVKMLKDKDLAVDMCLKINTGNNAKNCASKLSAQYVYIYEVEADAIASLCNKFRKNDLINECILGAVYVLKTNENPESTKVMYDLCKLSPKNFTSTCLGYADGRTQFEGRY